MNIQPFIEYMSRVIVPLQRQGQVEFLPAKGEMLITQSAFYVAAGITEEEVQGAAQEPPRKSLLLPSYAEPTALQLRTSMTKKMARFMRNMRLYLLWLAANETDESHESNGPHETHESVGKKLERSIAVHVLSELEPSDPSQVPVPIYTIILSRRRTWRTLWLRSSDHFDIVTYL